MIQRVIRIAMIVIMILGILFSISNFIAPRKIKAFSIRGVWVDGECMGDGNECDIGWGFEEDIGTTTSFEFSIKLQEKIEISPGLKLLPKPQAFCVTEDDLLILPDQKAGDIKIYKKNGNFLELTKTLGGKEDAPGEFVEPKFCYYNRDKEKAKFGVMDFGAKKIFIHDRIGRTEFELVMEVPCREYVTDIQIQGDKLFVSGFKADKDLKPYDLYYISIPSDQTTFLLPSFYKYGLTSIEEYKSKYPKKTDIENIGLYARFDVYGDNVYFVWEGDLRIIKLNFKTKGLNFFGKKPNHYVKPYPSEKPSEGKEKRNFDITIKENAEMSFLRDIFVNSKCILVIYEGPASQNEVSNFWLQFYNLDGDFINEVLMPGKHDPGMWFDKDKDILYSLSNDKGKYYILKYKITSD
ncbi:hypothetical protein ACFLRT_02295 [Acidobacteriota bacterium]